MTTTWMPWCKSHYTTEHCKEIAAKLRKEGRAAKLGYHIKENGKSYAKVYVKRESK